MHPAFEFFQKIRAPFYAFHDRDIAPANGMLGSINANQDDDLEGEAGNSV